ncbi:hypothetical protein [Mahella australiensis]|uniref:Uncharacterized protein n=1 Tax=Mahella australiensis (strain DSM 15567 / CIP 107919 / 50-1 BON) TaxID=697281 RepID=F3ZVU6_MAHA5|nr:hypothetical protein [Mahella australiensis]AEE95320.1 hypothetical protein Mahau_0097 [Mahella australiensis 50-1 BON]
MEVINAKITSNVSELQELLNKAIGQADELAKTLEVIKQFELKVGTEEC